MSLSATTKQLLKRAAARIAPESTTAYLSARARARSHELVEAWGLGALNRKLLDRLGPRVQAGPFQNMQLSPMTWKEHLGPYLLGTYEAELHPWFDSILQHPYTGIIDIGSKFGYYAVGLALRYPGARVVAFDTDPWARAATREMASANGVGANLEIFGYCTPARLTTFLTTRSLIISDCEGYEGVLFGDGDRRALKTATIIIELHEDLNPGVGKAIRSALGASHDIEECSSDPSIRRAAPAALDFLPASEAERATQEIRPPQTWLLLRPRAALGT